MVETIMDVINVLFYIAVTILAFIAKKYLTEYVKQTAELQTIKEKTLSIETVKKGFNEELETFKTNLNKDLNSQTEQLKAQLSKENNTHQLYLSEFVSYKFKILNELNCSIYDLYIVYETIRFTSSFEKYGKEVGHILSEYGNSTRKKFHSAKPYISDELKSEIDTFFKAIESIISSYLGYIYLSTSENKLTKNDAAIMHYFEEFREKCLKLKQISDNIEIEISMHIKEYYV